MTSVLGQTYSTIEYIVIDGGSNDGSKEYIETRQDSLVYWVSEPDTGIYNAMNKGIDKATGEYLLFLNSGDWLADENVIKGIKPSLEGCDLLYGNMIKVLSNGKLHVDKGPKGKPITLNTFFKGTLNHPVTFISTRLFDKHGKYDESIRIVSDWKWFLIALGLNDANIKYADINISYFDMGGISNINKTTMKNERKQVLQEILPVSIYDDYIYLSNIERRLNSKNIKLLTELEQSALQKKIIFHFMKLLKITKRLVSTKRK